MSQLARHYQEQEGGGGGMLGTSEEAQRFGEQTVLTTGGRAAEGREGRAFPPAAAGGASTTTPTTGTTPKTTTTTTSATTSTAAPTTATASKMSLAPFDDAPPGVKRILSALTGMLSARGMGDHCAVIGPAFARDVVIDTPFAILHRKGQLRIVCYTLFGSLFEAARFEPVFVEYGAASPGTNALEVVGQMVFRPKRTLLLPPSLLLPRELKFRAAITVGVRGDFDSGLIEFARFRPQNLPIPPAFLRSAIGGTVASALHASEPVWSQFAWLWGDNFWAERNERHRYQQQQQRMMYGGHGGHGYEWGIGGAMDAAHDLSNAAIDFGSSLASRAAEYAGYAAATARHAAEAVLPEALLPGGGTGATTVATATTAMPSGYGYDGATTATTTTTGGGLAGAARDVPAKGADAARKTAAKVGEAAGLGGAGAGAGKGPTYAAVAAPESSAARRRERTATGAGY